VSTAVPSYKGHRYPVEIINHLRIDRLLHAAMAEYRPHGSPRSAASRPTTQAYVAMVRSSAVVSHSRPSRVGSLANGFTSRSVSLTTKAPSRRCAQRSSRIVDASAGPDRVGDETPGIASMARPIRSAAGL